MRDEVGWRGEGHVRGSTLFCATCLLLCCLNASERPPGVELACCCARQGNALPLHPRRITGPALVTNYASIPPLGFSWGQREALVPP